MIGVANIQAEISGMEREMEKRLEGAPANKGEGDAVAYLAGLGGQGGSIVLTLIELIHSFDKRCQLARTWTDSGKYLKGRDRYEYVKAFATTVQREAKIRLASQRNLGR